MGLKPGIGNIITQITNSVSKAIIALATRQASMCFITTMVAL